MSSLASRIERYIKDMMAENGTNCLELKRNELAQTFTCVPSQINYVLETRFRDEQGYHVVSRRGAGGCFQIIRLEVTDDSELKQLIDKVSQSDMTRQTAEGLLNRLLEEDFLNKNEYMLLNAVISPDSLSLAGENENALRAQLMKNILITLLRVDY
ncbi:MAG: CtsR family transcriptional regulator [Bacillota bacterium]|nr:CtsR family transcriptional regulator [Bacillota bacterium]